MVQPCFAIATIVTCTQYAHGLYENAEAWLVVWKEYCCLIWSYYCFLQVLLNMIEYGMDPQAALDAPRFCIGPSRPDADSIILLEDGLSVDTVAQLRSLGHSIHHPVVGYDRAVFGRGQIIRQLVKNTSRGTKECDGGDMVRVWCGGSDGRGDGAATGYWVVFMVITFSGLFSKLFIIIIICCTCAELRVHVWIHMPTVSTDWTNVILLIVA